LRAEGSPSQKGKNLCFPEYKGFIPFYARRASRELTNKKETPYGMKWSAESFMQPQKSLIFVGV